MSQLRQWADEDAVTTLRRRSRAAGRWLFGDRHGLVLWLGLLCWFGLTWRVGFFIQDTYAVANALVALADGHLHVTELRYSIIFASQPGLHEYGGRLYGRNYGQLALAVPLVWALEALAVVVDPRLLLAGLWAGLGLGLVVNLGRLGLVDQRWQTVGAAVVGVLFLASVATATELPRERLALVAFQLSTVLAAATSGLVCYRLFRALHGRRVGLAAGAALGAATPVGFWATLPKRHTVVAMLTLGAVYAFAVSRQREGRAALQARAGAYILAGYITWVHAFEALFVVVTLGVVDLLTARSTGIKEVVVVGLALSVAIMPMAATNYAISGNPAEPPRLLPSVGTDVEFSPLPEPENGGTDGSVNGTGGSASGSDGSGSGTSGATDSGSDGGGGFSVAPVVEVVQSATGTISAFAGQELVRGVNTLNETDRLWHTFVRSGSIPSVRYGGNDNERIELALLEAMPVLGALAALPVLFGRRLLRLPEYSLRDFDPRRASPARKTDLLVLALALIMTIVYLPRLPLFSTLTVRYLHPVVPLACYGVCRIPAVRAGAGETRWLGRSYLAALAVAIVVSLGGIVGLGLAVGEAVQFSALLNLAAAACGGVAVLAWTLRPGHIDDRWVATGLAVPAAFTTTYLMLAGLVYFRYGSYALDIVRVVAEWLPAL
jgi:uncharacterized membrane protein YgcG